MTVSSIVAYGVLLVGVAETNRGIQVNAIISYSFLLTGLSGVVRVLVHCFPWQRGSIFVYKLVRGYALLFFIVSEVVAEAAKFGVAGEEGAISAGYIFFIITTIEYYRALFELVLERETELIVEEHGHHAEGYLSKKATIVSQRLASATVSDSVV